MAPVLFFRCPCPPLCSSPENLPVSCASHNGWTRALTHPATNAWPRRPGYGTCCFPACNSLMCKTIRGTHKFKSPSMDRRSFSEDVSGRACFLGETFRHCQFRGRRLEVEICSWKLHCISSRRKHDNKHSTHGMRKQEGKISLCWTRNACITAGELYIDAFAGTNGSFERGKRHTQAWALGGRLNKIPVRYGSNVLIGGSVLGSRSFIVAAATGKSSPMVAENNEPETEVGSLNYQYIHSSENTKFLFNSGVKIDGLKDVEALQEITELNGMRKVEATPSSLNFWEFASLLSKALAQLRGILNDNVGFVQGELTLDGLCDMLGKLKQATKEKSSELLHWWKDIHDVYREDTKAWGFSTNPIFTVIEDGQGRIESVAVDENEIQRRAGIEPFLLQFADATADSKALAQERISRAKLVARDIEKGIMRPPKTSTLYKFDRRRYQSGSNLNVGKVFTQVGSVAQNASPFLKPLLLTALLLYGLSVMWGAYLLLSKGKQEELKNSEETKARIVNMRKANAQVSRDEDIKVWGIEGSLKHSGDKRELRIKLEEVRKMARKVRTQEQVQTSFASETQGDEPIDGCGSLSGRFNESFSDDRESSLTNDFLKLQALAKDLNDVRLLGTLEKLSFETGVEMFDKSNVNAVQADVKESPDDIMVERAGRLGGLAARSAKQFLEDGADVKCLDKELVPQALDNKGMVGKSGSKQVVTESRYGVNDYISQHPAIEDVKSKVTGDSGVLNRQVNSHAPSKGIRRVKPHIITSPEEARAKLAARKERSANREGDLRSSEQREKNRGQQESKFDGSNTNSSVVENVEPANSSMQVSTLESESIGDSQLDHNIIETQKVKLELDEGDGLLQSGVASGGSTEKAAAQTDSTIKSASGLRETSVLGTQQQKVDSHSEKSDSRINVGKDTAGNVEVEEELDWMRDEVLREIVFKVQANEEAGREPFYGLDSGKEKLFFKGLERKFQREGDKVKTWIKDRVENADYGLYGVGVDDPPEEYSLRWKDSTNSPKSQLMEKFVEDRRKLLKEQMGFVFPSSVSDSATSTKPSSNPSSSSCQPLSVSSQDTSLPSKTSGNSFQERRSTNSFASTSSKTVVTGSGQPLKKETSFQRMKKWGKELQMKYAAERDPQTRALMNEIGQDLDSWITEEEIEEADKLLSMGEAGEDEYIQRHYEKVKAKLKEQRDKFGREAMISKYKEYQQEPEQKLWWLDLSYVLCIMVTSNIASQNEALYCLDMTPDWEGAGRQNHVIAFQDRKDALNFCYLLQHKPEESKFEHAEVCPFPPEQLYNCAKAEGFEVTVLKKGQVEVNVGRTVDEVENAILEIGSGVYWEKLMRERTIDADAVLDQAFGFGSSIRPSE